MKFLSYQLADGQTGWGVIEGDTAVDLTSLAPDLKTYLSSGAKPTIPANAPRHPLNTITFLPPITNPDKIICIGLNFMKHILEGNRPVPTQPTIFTRFANSQTGHLQPLVRPAISDHFDFEGELALVVGKAGRHISRADAASHIAGYSCYNDGSVRDWQHHTTQFTPGKNFHATGGFGPWLVTPDEFGDSANATLITRLNGEEMQRGTIDDLVFDIPGLIEYCSTFTALEPGDIIVTGTPGGVGVHRKPPLFMKPGDTVEVEISGIGILQNPVAQES
jgi:2-keto-4-pentenoate hydratase/2-oxohepta-3-ene-1,7-dioic acid hydratase in catechol pathway